jgi:hypothetical protein
MASVLVFEVAAPAGPLGLSFEPGTSGSAVVKQVHAGSPLSEKVHVGNLLLSLNNKDMHGASVNAVMEEIVRSNADSRTMIFQEREVAFKSPTGGSSVNPKSTNRNWFGGSSQGQVARAQAQAQVKARERDHQAAVHLEQQRQELYHFQQQNQRRLRMEEQMQHNRQQFNQPRAQAPAAQQVAARSRSNLSFEVWCECEVRRLCEGMSDELADDVVRANVQTWAAAPVKCGHP